MYVRFTPETDSFIECWRSMADSEPSFTFRKVEATTVATTGVSAPHQLVHLVLKTLGYSPKKVLVKARPSSNEIAKKAFLVPHDRYEAQGRRFLFSVDDGSFRRYRWRVYGCSRGGIMLYIRPNSKRTRISSGLATRDSYGGLSVARREVSYNTIDKFAESLKTFP